MSSLIISGPSSTSCGPEFSLMTPIVTALKRKNSVFTKSFTGMLKAPVDGFMMRIVFAQPRLNSSTHGRSSRTTFGLTLSTRLVISVLIPLTRTEVAINVFRMRDVHTHSPFLTKHGFLLRAMLNFESARCACSTASLRDKLIYTGKSRKLSRTALARNTFKLSELFEVRSERVRQTTATARCSAARRRSLNENTLPLMYETVPPNRVSIRSSTSDSFQPSVEPSKTILNVSAKAYAFEPIELTNAARSRTEYLPMTTMCLRFSSYEPSPRRRLESTSISDPTRQAM
mmetsp:Transcript_3959/g.10887  ORF Transcript_3959/g.10887 Transcript_3959/m.10887 type:complete len:287 (+) Transcript_3959:3018-3878(+)